MTHEQRIFRWVTYSIVFGVIAGGLCGFTQNGGLIPVNKNMWSLSFILTQASTGIIAFIIFYLAIDVFKIWDGKPFHWMGQNSIIIYVGSEVLGSYFPFAFEVDATTQTHAYLLLSNVIGISCWIFIAYYLFKNELFYNL